MKCVKCSAELVAGAEFCHKCGKKQTTASRPRGRRQNGQGSVYKPSGSKTWMAAKILGYEPTSEGKVKPVIAKKSGFSTKAEAIAYLPYLGKEPKHINADASFGNIYGLWLPEYQRRGRSQSTENCYKAASKYFRPIWHIRFADIGIDDLQECIDDCPHGRRTRENMKALAGLMYNYAIPRGYLAESGSINFARYLFVGGDTSAARVEFKANEIEQIKSGIGVVPYAEWIYCQIYLGFRPHEFITLDIKGYNRTEQYIVGGEKTDAGIDRVVTISPKILPIIERLTSGRDSGAVFGVDGKFVSLKKYRDEIFYPALEQLGIHNPVLESGVHKYTPHCCRHTFATLMKNVQAADKDKLALIGHSSTEMLRHYQHTNFDDLRRITDAI